MNVRTFKRAFRKGKINSGVAGFQSGRSQAVFESIMEGVCIECGSRLVDQAPTVFGVEPSYLCPNCGWQVSFETSEGFHG